MKLLGVPKIQAGTDEAQAQAVYQMINEWKLNDYIQLMCFDTTASNTGIKAGACALLLQKLEKPLYSLACRHHVLELTVAKVFDVLMGCSSGPNIKQFERSSASLNHINNSSYEPAMNDDSLAAELQAVRDDLICFFRQHLQDNHPRDDYKELLQLCCF